ncbi:S8 family serine peptidase [Tumebacillus lipolyticus]|uniref:S8 family serine peptidase n=1 Tax=Tumebacillus lipolyticus TaxID=1280370 RepID=A0ABW4ZUJ5_9BACL
MAKVKKIAGAILAVALGVALLPSAGVTAEKSEATVSPSTDQIIVKMKPSKVDQTATVAAKSGATVKKSIDSDLKVLKVSDGNVGDVLAKLKADPNVEYAELDPIMTISLTPNDPSYSSQYHLTKIQAPAAWDITTGSTSTKIAIIDTGVDLTHPDLSAKIIPGYDFANGDSVAQDDHGHGTQVAGVAAASTNNYQEGAGVDWQARIMPIKVVNAGTPGYTSDVILGVKWAAANGAHIILMSLDSSLYNAVLQTEINNAWAAGAVIVAPAGNSGNTVRRYPAGYNNVVAVAWTDSADNKSSYSTYGSWVHVAAPGTSIRSTRLGGGMSNWSGTSMAASVVAGLAGLVRANNPSLSNAGIVNKIFTGADPITGTGVWWRYGRVNALNSL